MSAYLIVEIEVHEPIRYETYKQMADETIRAHGGRYLVRGGKAENLEGNWIPKRVVMVEFPSVEQAKAWWGSQDYAPAKAIRQATAHTQMILVEGV
jgi:uncharacterized protein (DUF1330 family)